MTATNSGAPVLKHQTQTISITSGKGGVGKTTFVANLAMQFGNQGKNVLLLDGDFGMANLDIMFGVRPHWTVEHVLEGEKPLKDVITQVAPRISLIPGGSGVYGLSQIPSIQKRILLDQVSQLENNYDVMIIDTAPGIDDNVLYFNTASQEIVVILTPDPSSLADAYALIKVLNTRHKEARFSVVCNMVRNESEAKMIFKRLSDVASKFLVVSLDYRGYVPLDPALRNATKLQQLVTQTVPSSPSSYALRDIAKNLSGYRQMGEMKGGIQFFWEQLLGVA